MVTRAVLLLAALLSFVQHACGDTCTGTLWCHDPVRRAASLARGLDACFYYGYYTFNRGADIGVDCGANGTTRLVVAPDEPKRVGRCLDLGTLADVATMYKFNNSVPLPSMYTSVHWNSDHDTLMIAYTYPVDEDTTAEFQRMNGTIMDNLTQALEPNYQCDVQEGHMYLIRIGKNNSDHHKFYAKLLVLSATRSSVTLRWDVLYDSDDPKGRAPCSCKPDMPTTHGNNILGESTTAWAVTGVLAALVTTILLLVAVVGCLAVHVVRITAALRRTAQLKESAHMN
eukprot:TRINITY_DN8596_c1_g1_i1.p1 TRINITY_DN8596_c1_g1~~TRINITY_DN8596_c1_g1_i1.p1  ORF type:complete len:292 (-),score=75.98 TRINITY_DN8596_c1_g1_i1:46-900(-)